MVEIISHPITILLIGILIVLCGILWLRLHAFLALLLAGMTVAMLTPESALQQYADKQLHPAPQRNSDGSLKETQPKWTASRAKSFVASTAPQRVAVGMGDTCGKIGILIAMAAIIGKCLLDSGAADRVVRSALRLVGEKRAGLAFMGSGFLLSIPVFFDTVFYLMIPLGKAMRLRTGANYLLFILAIVAGGAMAHSLVPPTPGPLIVADLLNVSILDMIVGGCLVGLFASSAGFLFARWINRRMEIPLRDAPDASIEKLIAMAERGEDELPPFWMSILPIVLPVGLIALGTATKTYFTSTTEPMEWLLSLRPVITILGDKNMALIIAAVIAMLVLVRQQPDKKKMAEAIQHALAGGGIIILITSAGGGFGAAIRQSGIAELIATMQANVQPLMILPIAFLITMLIRTAQGSATVAMITAGSVLAPLALEGNLPFHSVYLALAIGCGSKPIAWMADSGFWVICKMSGMTEQEALKTVTPMSVVMGFSGLGVTLLGAFFFPLVG